MIGNYFARDSGIAVDFLSVGEGQTTLSKPEECCSKELPIDMDIMHLTLIPRH